jgi:hypothetical protein
MAEIIAQLYILALLYHLLNVYLVKLNPAAVVKHRIDARKYILNCNPVSDRLDIPRTLPVGAVGALKNFWMNVTGFIASGVGVAGTVEVGEIVGPAVGLGVIVGVGVGLGFSLAVVKISAFNAQSVPAPPELRAPFSTMTLMAFVTVPLLKPAKS